MKGSSVMMGSLGSLSVQYEREVLIGKVLMGRGGGQGWILGGRAKARGGWRLVTILGRLGGNLIGWAKERNSLIRVLQIGRRSIAEKMSPRVTGTDLG